MRPLFYFASCAALVAATTAARFGLARFIPAPTDDPSTTTTNDRSN